MVRLGAYMAEIIDITADEVLITEILILKAKKLNLAFYKISCLQKS